MLKPYNYKLAVAMSLYEPPKAHVSDVSEIESGRSGTIALGFNLLALCVYAVGLLSPLTPSEGVPSPWMVLLFVGGPIGLFLSAARFCLSFAARVFCYFELMAVAGFSTFLLLLQTDAFHFLRSLI